MEGRGGGGEGREGPEKGWGTREGRDHRKGVGPEKGETREGRDHRKGGGPGEGGTSVTYHQEE